MQIYNILTNLIHCTISPQFIECYMPIHVRDHYINRNTLLNIFTDDWSFIILCIGPPTTEEYAKKLTWWPRYCFTKSKQIVFIHNQGWYSHDAIRHYTCNEDQFDVDSDNPKLTNYHYRLKFT